MRIHGQGAGQGSEAGFWCTRDRKNLLQEVCLRLKARVKKVENTMKEMLESVDKLQADLNEANALKLASKN